MVDRLLPQAPNGSSVTPTLEEIENPCQDPNLHSTFLCDRIGTVKILRRRYPVSLHRDRMIGSDQKSCVHCRGPQQHPVRTDSGTRRYRCDSYRTLRRTCRLEATGRAFDCGTKGNGKAGQGARGNCGIPTWAVRLVGGCQNLVVFRGQLRRVDERSDSTHNSHQIA